LYDHNSKFVPYAGSDAHSERLVQDALAILVLEAGRIVESGTH
jgi:hypothetical protein